MFRKKGFDSAIVAQRPPPEYEFSNFPPAATPEEAHAHQRPGWLLAGMIITYLARFLSSALPDCHPRANSGWAERRLDGPFPRPGQLRKAV